MRISKQKTVNGKRTAFFFAKRNLLTAHYSLFTTFFLLFTLYSLLSTSPCFAFFGKSQKPIINPKEKLDYVNIDWWDNFSDPCLKYYIIKAVENNHDAQKASWQVEEYRQNVKIQFSQELPSASVGANYILNHLQDIFKGTKTNVFAVPFLANYEADIFLKNHDKTKSSKKSYEASKFQEQSTYISLASDVATAYINLIKFDKQIKLQEDLVCVKKQEFLREAKKYKNGTVSATDLNNAKKDYLSSKSNLDELIKSRDTILNQLAVFIGESPNNIACLKRNSFDSLEYKAQIPCEISSDVVFSRPDILAAEANLEKAKIDIRVARKEFLPRINVFGIYSFTNLGSTSFGSWNSTLAALFLGATQDLFKGGYKVANLRLNKAKYEEMFETYRQTDLTALKEINDSLLIIKEDTKIDNNTVSNLKIQQDTYNRANKSYKQGTISYPDLLGQCEMLLTTKQNQTNSKASRLVDYITLYKSIGGGKCLNQP